MKVVTKTATQARAELFDLIAAASKHGQSTTITLNGLPAAQINPLTHPVKTNWPGFVKALEAAKGIFTEEDEKEILQVRLDSYKNKYPEW